MSTFTLLVPARLHSTRLPQKLLRADDGVPLLSHSLKNLQPLRHRARIWLVTDSEELEQVGSPWVDGVHRSTREFDSGSERIVEALPKVDGEWILNVQADEPEIDLAHLNQLMDRMEGSSREMGTLATPFESESTWLNPNAVKVLVNRAGEAITFSRSPLPHGGSFDTPGILHHIGVYAYRKSLLSRWADLPRGEIEPTERLEQFRALENAIPIVVERVACSHKGIDTLEDYQAFLNRQKDA